MATETIQLRADDRTSTAAATVVRYESGARSLRAAIYIVGGLVLGTACIVIPVLHLITTWALPLLGIILGIRASKTCARVRDVKGPCPSCGESIALMGGAVATEPLRERCSSCDAVVELSLSEPPETPSAAPPEMAMARRRPDEEPVARPARLDNPPPATP